MFSTFEMARELSCLTHSNLEAEESDKGHFLHLLGFQKLCFLLYLIRPASCKAIHCSGKVHMINYDNYNQLFTIFAAFTGFKYHSVCQKGKIMSLFFAYRCFYDWVLLIDRWLLVTLLP